jgi:hypothetical protein
VQVAVCVQKHCVAGDGPTIDKRLGIGLGFVVVPPEDHRALDLEQAWLQMHTNSTGRRVHNTDSYAVQALPEREVPDIEVFDVAWDQPCVKDVSCLKSSQYLWRALHIIQDSLHKSWSFQSLLAVNPTALQIV